MKTVACIGVFLSVGLLCFSQTPAAEKQVIPVFKNKEYFFSGAVRLASAKYVNCTFHLAANAALQLENDSVKLIFKNCTLQANDTALWQGLHAQGKSSKVVFENCVVKNCIRCFVAEYGAAAVLKNNRFTTFHRALVFNDYDDPADVTITGNTFTGSDNLPAPYSGQRSACIICIDDVQRITIGNLSGVANTLSTADKGILTSYIKLLPNPNNGTFAFEYDLRNYATAAVELFDGTGRIVLIKYFSTAKNYESVEATVLPAGMYGYRIKLNGMPFRSGKIAIVK